MFSTDHRTRLIENAEEEGLPASVHVERTHSGYRSVYMNPASSIRTRNFRDDGRRRPRSNGDNPAA